MFSGKVFRDPISPPAGWGPLNLHYEHVGLGQRTDGFQCWFVLCAQLLAVARSATGCACLRFAVTEQ